MNKDDVFNRDYPARYGSREAVYAEATRLLDSISNTDRVQSVLGILDALTTQHRYHQNNQVWILLEALGSFGLLEPRRFTDARNEHSHAACGALAEAVKDRIYFPEVGGVERRVAKKEGKAAFYFLEDSHAC